MKTQEETKVIAENYDGNKAYIGSEKFHVVELDRRLYLLLEGTFNVEPYFVEDGSGIEAYRILRGDRRLADCVEVVRETDKGTLAALVKQRTEDLEDGF